MSILWVDFETRSRCDLPARGVYNYAQDGTTEVLCMSYAFDDDEVVTWRPGEPFPERVELHTGQIRAHNAAFERLIFWYVLQIDYKLEQFYCTAAQARANCAPGSLEDVGRFASADMKKDYRGAQLIRLLSLPQADGSFREDAALLAEMIAYCEQDVRAMRAVSKAMRDLSAEELADYHVNERINDRGVLVDVELCKAAIKYASEELVEIEEIVADVTKGEVASVRSPKMREWVLERVGDEAKKMMTVYKDGEKKFSIDKTVRANLLVLAEENPDEIPPDVAEVIQCADDLWASSVAKFSRLAALADEEDHRVRGAFVFAGGSATGRASSYGAQVHNFTRKVAAAPEDVRHAMVRGHGIVPKFGKRVTDVLKGMLRPALVPARGHVLIVADWSAIEARMNPWLSADPTSEAKLDLFRKNEDVYKHNASRTFHAPVEEIDKDQRQIGKVQELACLSEDTLVLTSCGEKAIQDVLPGDQVWDGHNWVRTDGAIYKGEKYVIEYDGVCATPDHLVWVQGETNPIEFGTAAVNRLCLVRAGPSNKTAISVASKAIVGGQTTVRESEVAGLQNVWGAWNYIPVSDSSDCLRMGFGEHRGAAIEYGTGPHRQFQRICARQFEMVNESAKQKAHCEDHQHSRDAQISFDVSRGTLCGQYDEEFVIDGSYFRANSQSLEPPKLQAKRRVWDLLNCGPFHRFTASGRLVHNCGYGGGIGAFAAMGRIYGVHLPESDARRMVDAWRRANPWAVTYWQKLESAYTRAMRHKGHEFNAGRVAYLFDGQHLWYALPSGRVLCYPYARLESDGVSYAKASWKPAADAKEWPRARLWKGLACENITQAAANDVLRHSLRQLDGVVLHVHDEIVLEVPESAADAAVKSLHDVMCTAPGWASGLPLEAEINIMRRYGK
jgi:DNA polymerase